MCAIFFVLVHKDEYYFEDKWSQRLQFKKSIYQLQSCMFFILFIFGQWEVFFPFTVHSLILISIIYKLKKKLHSRYATLLLLCSFSWGCQLFSHYSAHTCEKTYMLEEYFCYFIYKFLFLWLIVFICRRNLM